MNQKMKRVHNGLYEMSTVWTQKIAGSWKMESMQVYQKDDKKSKNHYFLTCQSQANFITSTVSSFFCFKNEDFLIGFFF